MKTPAEAARERVETGRLPQAGVPAPSEVAALPPEDEAQGEDAAETVAEDALTRNAAVFDNPIGLPVLSIVLLDGGAVPLDLPFQATFALDPASGDALSRAMTYRAEGHEIVALPALPEGATASDAANALAGSAALLDQAVALVDSPEGILQQNREALGEYVAEAAATGTAC